MIQNPNENDEKVLTLFLFLFTIEIKMRLQGKIIDRELSLKLLHTEYKDHRRLGVFHRKGTVCVCCGAGKEGVRLVENHTETKKGRVGSTHVDIFTKNWTLMTVDHIIPLSEGGTWHWSNLQPMCTRCNSKKGSLLITTEELRTRLGFGDVNIPTRRALA